MSLNPIPTEEPLFQQLAQQQQAQQAQQVPGGEGEGEVDPFQQMMEDTGEVAESPEGEGGEAEAPAPWIKDLTEDQAYKALVQAQNFPDRFEAYRGETAKTISQLQQQVQKMQGSPTEPSIDVDKIKQVLEKYDPGLASSGLAEVLAEAIKFTPVSQETLNPLLQPLQQQLGDLPIGNQIVLSHYDADDVKAIVPPMTDDGTPQPQTQRHKDFLEWFELQPHTTQSSLSTFGPGYVRALKKFESWEQGRTQDRSKVAGERSSRLAGGTQPSANRTRGQATTKTPDDLFLEGFNEV